MKLKAPPIRSLFGSCLLVATLATGAAAADWLTLPSTYSHSPSTGGRLNQYAAVDSPPQIDQSRLISSGYTHFRSTIQFGQSADNYHRVNQWGPPIRPYGEWEFPFRPFSVPYAAWGAPFAGLNLGGGLFGGFPGGGRPGHPGGGHPGDNYPGGNYGPPSGGIPGQPYEPYPANKAYPVPPWYGGFQPDFPITPPMNDREFFRKP